MSTENRYDAIPDSERHNGSQAETSSNSLRRMRSFENKYLADKNKLLRLILICILLLISLLVGLAAFLPDSRQHKGYMNMKEPIAPGISVKTFEVGLSKCHQISKQAKGTLSKSSIRSKNPRAPDNVQSILLKNATLWDGEGNVVNGIDILMADGVIREINHNIRTTKNASIIDVKGHIVSPGLVDMHTHLGVMSWPSLSGTSDGNEAVQPLVPFVRAIDAFNPSDKAINIVSSGGVTTALVLPGSSNLIGGEAYAFKLRPVKSLSNQDMLVQADVDDALEKKWRYLKMACGENPKNNYGRRQQRMPLTRMGEAYLLRQVFADAQKLVEAQNDWCSIAEEISYNDKYQDWLRLDRAFPDDISLESLTALLRGQVKLNIHCYETHDIEAMLRHAKEFGFEISAFHHALEAYRIPELIKKASNNITVATFADHWGFKKESYGASTKSPKILLDAGIPVAFKTDHPVINSQHLAFEAAKAAHYGLTEQEAFKAITSVPANALGLGHRLGSLKTGYDADVVIWDRHPLSLGASPLQVFIDGVPLFEQKPIEPAMEASMPNGNMEASTINKGSRNFIIKNIGKNYLNKEAINDFGTLMVIREGEILCASNCDPNSIRETDEAYEIIDIKGGYILPGIVAVGSKLGLSEIPSEGSTSDGIVPSSYSTNPKNVIEAIDGLKLGTKKLKEAYKGGVLTTISSPVSKNIVMGISTAFKTIAESTLDQDAILSRHAALHLQIGDSVKSSDFPTISSQIAFLRDLFTNHANSDNWYGKAVRGEMPIVVSVNNKDEIASIIRLKQTIIPNARLAIMGGAESHILAEHLAKANIAVILRPHLCTPDRFDSSHCLTGAPLTEGTAAHILHQHGVKIGLGVSFDGWARNLAWDAGWISATSPSDDLFVSEADAIAFVTTNLQEIFGLKTDDQAGFHSEDQSFVVWSGSPLDLKSKPLFTYAKKDGLQPF
ncbi:hypothetical protein EDC96DRAFT_525755 [Choanephora cucurbitarum]|nr:hypothetical protein EDC96DRAFT_525755 [Choanephora cucurbitarum]